MCQLNQYSKCECSSRGSVYRLWHRSCFLPVFSHHPYHQHRTEQNQSCAPHRGRTQSLCCVVVCQSIMRQSTDHSISQTHCNRVQAPQQTTESNYVSVANGKSPSTRPTHHITLSWNDDYHIFTPDTNDMLNERWPLWLRLFMIVISLKTGFVRQDNNRLLKDPVLCNTTKQTVRKTSRIQWMP